MIRNLAIVPLLAAVACSSSDVPEVCPAAGDGSVLPAPGDANIDQHVDVADIAMLSRHLFSGGAAPSCPQAMDVQSDDDLNISDAAALWLHAFGGPSAVDPLPEGACAPPLTARDTPACGRMAWDLEAPKKVEGGDTVSFEATVSLRSLDLDVDAWSLSVSAAGCTVAAATTAGTVGADRWLDEAGRRGVGMAVAQPTADAGGAVSAVVLSWLEDQALPASETPSPVLRLTIEAPAPSGGCVPCVLTLEDGQQGAGQPVRSVVSHRGFAYVPAASTAEVEVCRS